MRINFTWMGTCSYLLDVIMMRQQPVIWKTANFCKRNWLRFLDYAGRTEYVLWKVGKGIKHGVMHMVHGLKHIFKDGRWLL
jgi:hypothetical protein